MLCRSLCGKNLRRFHFTCIFCRIRRFYYKKLGSSHFHKVQLTITVKESENGVVIPKQSVFYCLVIDNNRNFKKLKQILLSKVLTLAEFLAN